MVGGIFQSDYLSCIPHCGNYLNELVPRMHSSMRKPHLNKIIKFAFLKKGY